MEEIWKDIEGYEGNYQVSNLGRVKRLGRVEYKDGEEYRVYRTIIMKLRVGTSGYYIVNLRNSNTGKSKTYMVHRLVALNFIEKNDVSQTLIVNHKDANKLNNEVSNLEWVTYSQNKKHAQRLGLHKDNTDGLVRYNESRMIPLVAIKNNKIILKASNSREMAEKLIDLDEFKGTKTTTIARNIRNRIHDNKSYKGYYFQRVDI